MRGRLNVVVTLLALTLVAAACSAATTPTTTAVLPESATDLPESPSTTLGTAFGDGVLTDRGTDPESKVIRLGILADLTGPFAALVTDVTDAQKVYWQNVNDRGGIEGWTVDLVIANTGSNVEQHQEAYKDIGSEVLAISQSTGSSTNLESLPDYIEDDMLVIPLSWYSGWAIPGIDHGVMLEQNTNYCLEAMNILDFVSEMEGASVAVVAFDDAYGRDALAGLRFGVDFYQINVALEGIVLPGDDITAVAGGIAESGADWTLLATNASIGSEVLAGAVQAGYTGKFIGLQPSYDFRLLDSAAADLYDTVFYHSGYTVSWGDDAPGNEAMMQAMIDAFPDRRPADTFIVGWNEAITMHRVLESAISTGNLTRSGVLRAANSLESVSFGGSTPDQSYVGTPNEHVQRASAIYKPNLSRYLGAGGSDQVLTQPNATTGSMLIRDFTIGAASEEFIFTRACAE